MLTRDSRRDDVTVKSDASEWNVRTMSKSTSLQGVTPLPAAESVQAKSLVSTSPRDGMVSVEDADALRSSITCDVTRRVGTPSTQADIPHFSSHEGEDVC